MADAIGLFDIAARLCCLIVPTAKKVSNSASSVKLHGNSPKVGRRKGRTGPIRGRNCGSLGGGWAGFRSFCDLEFL